MIDIIQKHPDLNIRLSTGAHQFGDDCPLYVMRGDNVISFLHIFREILERDSISLAYRMTMTSYVKTFAECIVNPNSSVLNGLNDALRVTEFEWYKTIESVRKSLCIGCKENDKIYITENEIAMHKRDYAVDLADISYPCTSDIIATILQGMSIAFVKKD